MSRYELGMSTEYVPSWGVVEACREIFQNAYDATVDDAHNDWYVDYDNLDKKLFIGNRKGKLDKNSLLLGVSSKRNNVKTIGQHGEGYKVATVVLLRNNVGLKIYNKESDEVWSARLVKSRRYNAEIAAFDIEDYVADTPVIDCNLVFELSGISMATYEDIKKHNLHLLSEKELGKTLKSMYGKVLFDDKYKGNIYVSGLYVCHFDNLEYGYDLLPVNVKLDRDRGLIDSFDLKWEIGKLIMGTNNLGFINKMRGTFEGEYLCHFTHVANQKVVQALCDTVYEDIEKTYGKDVILANNMEDVNKQRRRGKLAVLVTKSDYDLAIKSSLYNPAMQEEDDERTVLDDLQDWFDSQDKKLTNKAKTQFRLIFDELKKQL